MRNHYLCFGVAAALASSLTLGAPTTSHAANNLLFKMVVSAGAATCLPDATGAVTINSSSANGQNMHVQISHLPRNTAFDFFVIQVPKAPFGLSWYQGDIMTDANGVGVADFFGVFSKETFILAPGVAPAPKVFPDDATSNPATPPVQIYHLGLWFNNPASAAKAGCANTVTPFNGEHNAGIQVLNTSNFPDGSGPLRRVQ